MPIKKKGVKNMNAKIIMSLFMVFAMIGVAVPLAAACGNCDVEVPECHGCYVMTAEASLEVEHGDIDVSGSSTAKTHDAGTTTSVDIEADGGNVFLEVGSAVDRRPTTLDSYSVFGGESDEADIEMDTTTVVGGRRCIVNADANLDVETEGAFNGGSVANYGPTQNHHEKGISVVQSVTAEEIEEAEGDAAANNNLIPGTVYAGVDVDLGLDSVSTFAGATFYQSHFHH